jgi:hypothetical protein
MQTNSKSRDICRKTSIITKLDLLFNLARTAIPGCSLAGRGRRRRRWCEVDGGSSVVMGGNYARGGPLPWRPWCMVVVAGITGGGLGSDGVEVVVVNGRGRPRGDVSLQSRWLPPPRGLWAVVASGWC